ncbi:hypothetical protein ABT317_06165 [Streptomyces carpinensis]|uniref:Uncharacterized protein n=1 Tax=Streptomyces carpinensis TaxID=66369 RepID=A0ABV1VXH3_9ACTN
MHINTRLSPLYAGSSPHAVTEAASGRGENRSPGCCGGELRFYEHVRSPRQWAGWLEDVITPLWSRVGGGCHPNRDTEAAIRAAGFTVTDIDRFGFSFSPFVPKTLHIAGTAVQS